MAGFEGLFALKSLALWPEVDFRPGLIEFERAWFSRSLKSEESTRHSRRASAAYRLAKCHLTLSQDIPLSAGFPSA